MTLIWIVFLNLACTISDRSSWYVPVILWQYLFAILPTQRTRSNCSIITSYYHLALSFIQLNSKLFVRYLWILSKYSECWYWKWSYAQVAFMKRCLCLNVIKVKLLSNLWHCQSADVNKILILCCLIFFWVDLKENFFYIKK